MGHDLELIITGFVIGVLVGTFVPIKSGILFIIGLPTLLLEKAKLITLKKEKDEEEEVVFDRASFLRHAARVLGRIAEVDTPINDEEIKSFRSLFFDAFSPSTEARDILLKEFKEGVLTGRNLREGFVDFYWKFSSEKQDLNTLLNISIKLVISDGAKNSKESHALEALARTFGIHPKVHHQMEQEILLKYYQSRGYSSGQRAYGDSGSWSNSQSSNQSTNKNKDDILKSFVANKYYQILGCQPGATAAEVKKAYRKLAKAHHPDLSPAGRRDEGKRFREIQSAYDALQKSGRI